MSRFLRQLDILDPEKLVRLAVTVIGAGAVGSFTTVALAKMGLGDLTVYDDDLVTDHNLPNQFYREVDVGRPKVEALAEIVHAFAGISIKGHQEKYTHQVLAGLVVSAVDSMDARRTIWRRVRMNPAVVLFIDARMGAEVARVFTVDPTDPDDLRQYQASLHSSDDAFQAPCTARATVYCAAGISALIASTVRQHVAGERMSRELVQDWRLGHLVAA